MIHTPVHVGVDVPFLTLDNVQQQDLIVSHTYGEISGCTLEPTIEILAIRNFLTISEENLPQQVTVVWEKSTSCINP